MVRVRARVMFRVMFRVRVRARVMFRVRSRPGEPCVEALRYPIVIVLQRRGDRPEVSGGGGLDREGGGGRV